MGNNHHYHRHTSHPICLFGLLSSSYVSQIVEKERCQRRQGNRPTVGENIFTTQRKGKRSYNETHSFRTMATTTIIASSSRASAMKTRIRTCEIGDDCVVIDFDYVKVQPDVEELTPNMEDNEDADSKKSEAPNLGKLEYSLDYDFQKQEV
jgi:hypothetical protein